MAATRLGLFGVPRHEYPTTFLPRALVVTRTTRLGLFGIPRQAYPTSFLPRLPANTRITRLGLLGIPTHTILATAQAPTITVSGNPQAQRATVDQAILSLPKPITHLGLFGIPFHNYKQFVYRAPVSISVITMSGATQAANASVALDVVGNGPDAEGTPQAQPATIVADLRRVITMSGSRRAWMAPLTDQNNWFNQYWWVDAPKTLRATGEGGTGNLSSFSGSPQAQAASVAASIQLTNKIAAASVQAQNATSFGVLTVSGTIGMSGNPQAQPASINASFGNNISDTVQARRATSAGSITVVPAFRYILVTDSAIGYDDVGDVILDRRVINDYGFGTDSINIPVKSSVLGETVIADNGWKFDESLTPYNFNAVWYSPSDDLWVACGDNGVIYTKYSTGGWVARTSGVSASLRTVKKWNSTWVVCGYSGAILTSSDAINWTEVSGLTSTSVFVTMAFSDESLYVCGWETSGGLTFGRVSRLDVGGAWYHQLMGTNRWIYGITYNPSAGQFVLVGETTGDTAWARTLEGSFSFGSYLSPDFATGIWSVVWTGVNYVAGTGDGEVKYSSDIVVWQDSVLPVEFGTDNVLSLRDIGNGYLFLCGGLSTNGKILLSEDNGENFRLVYSTDLTTIISDASYDGINSKNGVAVGYDGHIALFDEEISISASVPISEVGTFTESLSIAVSVVIADSGVMTDALGESFSIPISDSGVMTDSVTVYDGSEIIEIANIISSFSTRSANTEFKTRSIETSLMTSRSAKTTFYSQ